MNTLANQTVAAQPNGRVMLSERKSKQKDKKKTFKNGQNTNGVFVANALFDLAELNGKWWTGTYDYVTLSMDESDDTEFRQFHQEIEKRTMDMDDYAEEKRTVEDSFTVRDGNGKEYIYVVKMDGYLHGVVLEKIDKAKYTSAFLKQTKGGQNGKSAANIKGRTRNERPGIGQNHSSGGRNRASNGNPGHGGVGSRPSQSYMAGIDEGEGSTNRKVPAVTDSKGIKKSDRNSDRDTKGRQLTRGQQEFFKDSVVRDEDGNLMVMYHGTSRGGHTIFDPWGKSNYGLFGTGSYFTDFKSIADAYTNKGKGNNKQVYEVKR